MRELLGGFGRGGAHRAGEQNRPTSRPEERGEGDEDGEEGGPDANVVRRARGRGRGGRQRRGVEDQRPGRLRGHVSGGALLNVRGVPRGGLGEERLAKVTRRRRHVVRVSPPARAPGSAPGRGKRRTLARRGAVERGRGALPSAGEDWGGEENRPRTPDAKMLTVSSLLIPGRAARRITTTTFTRGCSVQTSRHQLVPQLCPLHCVSAGGGLPTPLSFDMATANEHQLHDLNLNGAAHFRRPPSAADRFASRSLFQTETPRSDARAPPLPRRSLAQSTTRRGSSPTSGPSPRTPRSCASSTARTSTRSTATTPTSSRAPSTRRRRW